MSDNPTEKATPTPSRPWNPTTKLVVGLAFMAIIGALLVRFRFLVGPLILVFMLTYLLQPLVEWLSNTTRLTWRMAVNLVFIILVIVLILLFTATGFALVQQFQSLVRILNRFLTSLPAILGDLPSQTYVVGPYQIDFSQYLVEANLPALAEQILSAVQPMLGQAGGLLAAVASQTVSTLGWTLFVIVTAYFLLLDLPRVSRNWLEVEIPGMGDDLGRLGRELGIIWNAFLRGQVILFVLALVLTGIALGTLGTRYALSLALLAGLARFVPYIGPIVTWAVVALVAYFQINYLGLPPWEYTLLVVGILIILNQIFDNLISPRVLGETLGIHPAAILVAAIIAANLMGLIGIVLAAPVLASVVLIGRYALRKMLDLDPWPEPELALEDSAYPWETGAQRFKNLYARLRKK